ncbi:BamA/TamA family outer membrane protein [Flavobacteriaceae bacterium]|nr:BamA/TamA family outer membrane protein [Flavobacteriaceae bacterium]
MSSSKYLSLIYLFTIILVVNGCSSSIYQNFEDSILIENIFEVNDSIIKKDPVKLLIQPTSPTNKVFGFPLGLSIYNLASKNPDEKFEKWLYNKPNRYKRLSRLLSNKQIKQLKQYNNSFSKFLKSLGQKPTKITDTNVNENISRLKQFYNNEGYFDSKVSADTILNYNQASIKYSITKNTQYLIDSSGVNKKIPLILSIKNPNEKEVYQIRKINDINIYVESIDELSNIDSYTDSLNLNGIKIFSKGNLNYSTKSLTEPIFFEKGENYSEEKKLLTSRYFSNIGAFKYPRIIIEENNDSLSSSIYLLPRDRFSLGFDLDFTHSNIEDFGISFGTNFNIRNIFRGTENLSFNLNNSIGASKDIGDPNDSFFNLFELGGNLNLRIPRAILPFKTERLIKKEMIPVTNIIIGSTVQKNIGLDKQYYSGIYEVNWNPSKYSKVNFKLLDFEYVNNQNISNYFNVYKNSYDKLNYISSLYNLDQSTIDQNGDLIIPEGSDTFIDLVLNDETTLDSGTDFYKNVSSILERKDRLTENNLIVGSSISFNRNTQENFLDEDFSQLRIKFEMVGNLFNELLRGGNQNSNNKVEISNILPSQYTKAEVNYIKHILLNNGDVLALRAFTGIAVPYGNSSYIPFTRSYYAGGSNDNRAWKAYKLGPGSSNSINEFNEANLKIALNLEYRNKISGNLNGAFFIDFGNIWNVNDNVDDESMTFDNLSDLNELAIGTGIGLRYDFNFFVLRLDTAFKTYNPAKEKTNRWFTDFSLNKAVFNIGINYPF